MSQFSAFKPFSFPHFFKADVRSNIHTSLPRNLSRRARYLTTTTASTVGLCMLFGLGGTAHACTPGPGIFCVTTGLDDGTGNPGTLSAAINSANASGGGTIEIDDNFVTQVDITGDMPLINFNNPNAITNIVGNGATIDGRGQNRIFFVDAGQANLSDVTLADGHAQGGAGGDAGLANGSGGGGGMGAGGALFVNDGAVVNGSNVNFEDNNATGGSGGDGTQTTTAGIFSGGAGSIAADFPAGGGGGGGLGGNGGNGLSGGGGGGGFNGDGGTSESPHTNVLTTITPTSQVVTREEVRRGPPNGGGGGGGGGLNGQGGDARLGGGGGGSQEDGGDGGGFDCVRVTDFSSFPGGPFTATETCTGNTGGGGGGGGEVVAGEDAPTGTVTISGSTSIFLPVTPIISPTDGDGGNGDTANMILGGDTPANTGASCATPALDGADGDAGTTIANNGIGGGGGSRAGKRSNTNLLCSPGTDGGDGGNANSTTPPDDYSAGGGGGSGAASLASARDTVDNGDGGDGGDGGKYAGGGGGGGSNGQTNNDIGTVAGGNGGNGGDGGDYAGGGGAGGSDVTAITPANGGAGGEYGGGGGASGGVAGQGGYGGGGGAASYGTGGDGGFGGGGGGAGGRVDNPANPTLTFQGTAGTGGFGAGSGGVGDASVRQGLEVGGSAGGGGGLGAGGAVFVRQGGILNLSYTDDTDYNSNDVTGGAGGTGAGPGAGAGSSGQARGHAYFLDDSRATISVADGFTVTYDEDIDDAREIGRAGGMDKYDCGTMQYGVDNPTATTTLIMPYGDSTDIYEGEFNVQNNARLLYSTTNIGQTGGTQNNNCTDSPLLSGTGILADTNILSGGRHNVGNTPGDIETMTVVGDYVIANGGILEVDVGPGGAPNSDTIIVRDRDFGDADHTASPLPTGLSPTDPNAVASTVVIDPGAILRVMFQVGTYNNNSEWLLIDNEETDQVTSDGTTVISDTDILGGFAAVSHNLGFGNVEVETNGTRGGISDGNNVVLRFFGPLCDLTFNQNSTLGGSVTLDSLGQSSVAFNNLPDELKCPTLDTMSGEAHVSAAGMLLERSMALTGSIATRVAASWMQDGPAITGVRASQWLATWKRPEEVAAALEREEAGLERLPRSVDMAENPDQYPDGWGAPLEEPEKTTVWGRMLGDFRFVSGDGNAADAFRNGAGMMVGADTKTSQHTRLGIAVGIGRDWINVDERRGSSITVDSISASLYGSYTKEAWQAMLVGSVAHQMWDTKRHILFPDNSINRTARAEYDAFYWAVRGELGYMHLADNGWLIRPSATARWAELHTDGFRETGAGDINLQNDGEIYRSIQTSVGLRASREKQLDNGWMRTFQLKAEWLHQWSDHYQEATFVFEGGGSPTAPTTQTPFQIRSPEESPASAVLGLGVSFTNDTGITGFVTGDAILSPTTIHPSVAAGLKLRF